MSCHHGRAACTCLRKNLLQCCGFGTLRGLNRPLARGGILLRGNVDGCRRGQARFSAGLAVLAHRQFSTRPAPSVTNNNNGKTAVDAGETDSEVETVGTRKPPAFKEQKHQNPALLDQKDSATSLDVQGKSVQTDELDPASRIQSKETDQYVIFHQSSKKLLNLNLDSGNKAGVSLFFRPKKEVISLSVKPETSLKEDVAKVLEAQKTEGDWVPRLSSIDDVMWAKMKTDTRQLSDIYMKLAKIRLTGLVVVTQMAGYAMAPGAFELSTFLFVSLGTGLTSASANSINQFLEVPYDSQMNRTKNRPLVRGTLSPLHAVVFATGTGMAGVTLLAATVNPLTAGLGLFNLCLYTMCYTPLKRHSMVNTWVGAVVGAIPPMMGWAACTGALEPGAWLLAAIMYAWQFPHFNALSWNLRGDYSRAGYRMMSVLNPALCKRVTLRYSVGMIGLCTLAPVLGMTSWAFALDSLPLNLYLSYLAWNFYREADSNSSRKLFRFTLLHIPLILSLMLLVKKREQAEGASQPPQGHRISPLTARIVKILEPSKNS